jgi:demethylmenaquinone methyltransferase/2-methoxy-6-polyprenyl-1,4-benzoquinol methylase
MAPDHFGFLAPFYDRLFAYSPSPLWERLAALPARGGLLDLGGGTGRVSQALRGRVDRILVADLSPGMLRRAAAKGLETVCVRGERLPFPARTFSRALMVDAFHHVSDQVQTARELWRVLAPGGRIVILEPDIRHAAVKLIALFEKAMLMRSHFLPGAAIARLFPPAGGRVEVEREGLNVWVAIEKDGQGEAV